ncbi:MAG: glycosyltransferase family 2 protein [Candidatus Gastranaerophilales bacterium]|nr:glycosyltransferase family 2 protein [Candidatus Gastranaerophilales bacterium]
MTVKNKLDIILITYNRASNLRKTFLQILDEKSPIKDFDILVIDNNSTDSTYDVVMEFKKTAPNIKYQKNKYNVGLSANIVFAMYKASKDYVWIISDDDNYDFSNWNEVENAINQNEDIICCARYAIPDEHKNDIAYQLIQVTFLTGLITKTGIYNDTTIKSAFDNIYTIFPHMGPIVSSINQGKHIYVVDKPISDNGMIAGETDCSYIRGYNVDDLYMRTQANSWIVGYANILSALKDKKLISHSLEIAIIHPHIHGNFKNFYHDISMFYAKPKYISQFYDVWQFLPPKHQFIISFYFVYFLFKNYFENLSTQLLSYIKKYYIKQKALLFKLKLLFMGINIFTKTQDQARLNYLNSVKIQETINEIANSNKNKKILLYGIGSYGKILIEKFNFSKMNTIGICDKNFLTQEKYKNWTKYSPQDITRLKPDIIIYLLANTEYVRKSLALEGYNIKQIDLLKQTKLFAQIDCEINNITTK